MPKKKTAIKAVKATSYEKTGRVLDVVKKCQLLDLNREATLDVIEFDTGKRLSLQELQPLTQLAKREVKEQQLQVDTHMDYMIRIGLYEDTMKQHEQLTYIEKMIFSMIMNEYNKPKEDRNGNFILNSSTVLTKVHAAKNNTITNIGFLSKAKSILEQGNMSGLEGDKGTIIIERRKEDINKLVDQAIDVQEFEDNKVF